MRPLPRSLLTVAVAVLGVVVVALALGAFLRWGMRCDEGCYVRSTDPEQPWTRYRDSWQWHAQFVLALVALTASAGAVVTVRRRPLAGSALAALAAVAAAGWIGWYAATPLHG